MANPVLDFTTLSCSFFVRVIVIVLGISVRARDLRNRCPFSLQCQCGGRRSEAMPAKFSGHAAATDYEYDYKFDYEYDYAHEERARRRSTLMPHDPNVPQNRMGPNNADA